jgi:hypothetical protein
VKWALDAGALHLYDFPATVDECRGELTAIEQHAHSLGISVLYAEVFEEDVSSFALRECGFQVGDEEYDVRDRRVVKQLSLYKLL